LRLACDARREAHGDFVPVSGNFRAQTVVALFLPAEPVTFANTLFIVEDFLSGSESRFRQTSFSCFTEHIHHPVSKDINLATTVDSFPDVVRDDKPVIPPPAVMYEGHELIFAFDYDVACHTTTVSGNASLDIHGKNARKNKKMSVSTSWRQMKPDSGSKDA
jgi:hypothetical protein